MYLFPAITLVALAGTTLATPLSIRDSDPFTDANLTITSYGATDCTGGTIAKEVFYGVNYHAQAFSFWLSRDLTMAEQLDFSTTGDPGTSRVDIECAKFEYTASPQNGQPLAAQCYNIVSSVAGCFRF
ncbi:hypothetical protein P7C71_g1399, partial [Lecanoromycetidae sp. Uapishka_2]